MMIFSIAAENQVISSGCQSNFFMKNSPFSYNCQALVNILILKLF